MSLFAAPYVIAGSVSLFLGYKTYNSYYNQPFEYIEIEGFEEKKTEKSQEDDTISNINDKENNKIVEENVEDKKVEEKVEEEKAEEEKVEEEKAVEEKVEEEKAVEDKVEEKVEENVEDEKVTVKVANKIIDKIISDAVECNTQKEYIKEKMVVSLPNNLEVPFKKMETIPENEEKLFNQYPSNNLRRRKKKNKKRRN
jgi:hypothetical protein